MEEADATAQAANETLAVTDKKSTGKDVISEDDRAAARDTFVTAIGAETKAEKKAKKKKKNKFKALQATSAGPQITEHYMDLTNFAENLDAKMERLLAEHEKDFFLAYKTHMYGVQRDIKALRMKADAEDAKTREDSKIRALEGELDWFMTEALRLDELCKGYRKEVDKWKAKASALDEDRCFLEDQIKGAKRQNKILKAAAERARSSANSALLVTKARTEAMERTASHPALALTDGAADAQRRPLSAGTRQGAAGAGYNAKRSATPDAPMPALKTSASATTLGASSRPAMQTSASSGALPRGGGSQRQILGSESEERYVKAIKTLKDSITREQATIRMLQAARSTAYSKNSELEEFFLKCIDEARKELMRTRHLSAQKDKPEMQRVLEAMLSNEDVLVCLYEKLFPHRTGIARSFGPKDDGKKAAEMSLDEFMAAS